MRWWGKLEEVHFWPMNEPYFFFRIFLRTINSTVDIAKRLNSRTGSTCSASVWCNKQTERQIESNKFLIRICWRKKHSLTKSENRKGELIFAQEKRLFEQKKEKIKPERTWGSCKNFFNGHVWFYMHVKHVTFVLNIIFFVSFL